MTTSIQLHSTFPTSPFSNNLVFSNKVISIHQSCVTAIDNLPTPITIKRALIHPEANGLPNISKQDCEKIETLIKTAPPKYIQWAQFGVYNQIHCAIMPHQYALIKLAELIGIDTNQPIAIASETDIQTLGRLTTVPSQALAVKYIWLYKQSLQPTPAWFMGNAAITSPVKNFLRHHLGFKPDQINNLALTNRLTFTLAQTHQTNPVDINTTMWILGK